MSNKFLDAALGYIERGFSVVILGYRDKMPVTVHTPNGLNDATTDPDTVRKWWNLTPKCNVGAVCGGDSRKIAIDLDCKNGEDGYSTMRDWEMEHGDLPDTLICCTPTGGYHLYYEVDRPVAPSVNKAIGVDIRGDGSIAVLPPSIHPDTLTEYVWEDEDVPIAKANDLVYQFIDYVRPAADEDGGGGEFTGQEEVREGGRDNAIYRLACSQRAKSLPKDVVLAACLAYNASHCKPPLPESEVRKKVESAFRHKAGYSEEFKARSGNNVNAKTENPPNKTARHVVVARTMLDKYSACFLDGAPAVFDGLTYRIGWDAVETTILKEWPNSRDRDRKEVVKYLSLVMPKEQQSPPRYIGFANGVLDVETMDLMSFSPRFRIPNIIPHDWNPEARSDVLDDTLRRLACNDPFIESNLCEFIGLCMFRSGKYAYAAILLGRQEQNASNGKSTYIDLIRNVLGDGNYSSLSLRALGERFNQQYLAGKLANLGDDISSEFTDGTSLEIFKKAVAGNRIPTDVKNSKGFEFDPYCTMVFSANRFPKMEKLDDGALRRIHPIRFNAHFTRSDPDFDPDIGEKLRSEDAAEAAIVRGVWGLRRVIEQHGPTENDESKRMVHDIKTDNSTILQWIEDEFVTRDELIGYETKAVYARYDKWCDESGVRKPYGKRLFSQDICATFKLKVHNTSRNDRSVRVFAEL